jgi:hypothetical protein
MYEEAVISKKLAPSSHKIIFPTTMVTVDDGQYFSNHLSKLDETKSRTHLHYLLWGVVGVCCCCFLSEVGVGLYWPGPMSLEKAGGWELQGY